MATPFPCLSPEMALGQIATTSLSVLVLGSPQTAPLRAARTFDANLVISASAAGANHGVNVTINGQTSPTVNFYVQIPTHLARIDEPGTPNNGTGPLNTGTDITVYDLAGNVYNNLTNQCGGYQWRTYALADQQGNRIQNGTVTFTESFANISPSNDPLPWPAASSSPNLATQVLSDIYGILKAAPSCPPANLSDSADQSWTATVGTTPYTLQTVIHITRATNSQGLPSFTSLITTP